MLATLDASSIIYAWDNYPIEQFPRLWEWLCEEILNGNLKISKVSFDEVKKHYEECAQWMDDCGIDKIDISIKIVQYSREIHHILGIDGDAYGGGVGENDIIIIATAMDMQSLLISNEKIQTGLPDNKKNYKIPAVCRLEEVRVRCIDFLEYLKKSERVF